MEEPFNVKLRLRDGFALDVHCGIEGWRPLLLDEAPPLGRAAGPSATTVAAAAIGHALCSALLFALHRSNIDVMDLHAVVSGHSARSANGSQRLRELQVVLTPRLASDLSEQVQSAARGLIEQSPLASSIRDGINLVVEVAWTHGTAPSPEGAVQRVPAFTAQRTSPDRR